MEVPTVSEPDSSACFLSSSPVFDSGRAISGVAVSYQCLGVSQEGHNDVAAFKWLVSAGLSEIERLIEEYGTLYVPLGDGLLADPDVGLLPWDRCVIEVTAEETLPEGFVEACEAIRVSGYRLAVRLGFVPSALGGPLRELLDLADSFVLDLSRMRPLEMVSVFKMLQPFERPVMAARLDTWEDFTGAKALGVDLFQGAFFGRPEVVKGKALQANSLARLELLRALQNDNTTFKEIGAIITKDAFLSYRLVSFVNAPGLSMGREVKSIEHAVALLGFEVFKQWAMTAVVSSLDASSKGELLAALALQRGRFLSNLCAVTAKTPYAPPKMFLLGLFSLLDAMLDQPMDEVVEHIPMDKTMKSGLCRRKSPALGWLALLDDLDTNDWEGVRAFLSGAGVDHTSAAKAYLDAVRWSRMCFQAVKGGQA